MTEYDYTFDDLHVHTDWRSFIHVRFNGKLISEMTGDCRPLPVLQGKSWPNDLESVAREEAMLAFNSHLEESNNDDA